MKIQKLFYVFVLVFVMCFTMLPMPLKAQRQMLPVGEESLLSILNESFKTEQSLIVDSSLNNTSYKTFGDGGIKEEISNKYSERYEKWKKEFLSTRHGRAQWDLYAKNPNFTLTITVSDKKCNGGGTGKFKWDESGKLISATITIGCRIDEGYPNPIYYPVMNSLSKSNTFYFADGNILAATKIAHEFGHVNHASKINGEQYRKQNQLMAAYNKILLSNGHNINDPRLIELENQMGGTPIKIWEDREYWGETNAMLFLKDRITNEHERKALFNRIIQTVELFAKDYIERFDQIAQ